jgi:hypothetical protein
MTQLIVTPAFESDLDALDEGTDADRDAVDAAEVLIEELAGNLSVLADLFSPGLRADHDPLFEVKRFEEVWKTGYNILIFKYWDLFGALADYRIFVGYHALKDTYYALAITHRSIAYDNSSENFNTLLVRYQSCDIPVWR